MFNGGKDSQVWQMSELDSMVYTRVQIFIDVTAIVRDVRSQLFQLYENYCSHYGHAN